MHQVKSQTVSRECEATVTCDIIPLVTADMLNLHCYIWVMFFFTSSAAQENSQTFMHHYSYNQDQGQSSCPVTICPTYISWMAHLGKDEYHWCRWAQKWAAHCSEAGGHWIHWPRLGWLCWARRWQRCLEVCWCLEIDSESLQQLQSAMV